MNTLLILLSIMVSQSGSSVVTQESPGFPQPEFTMKCYPKTVMPGDTFYVTIDIKNPFDKSIYTGSINDGSTAPSTQIRLKDTENQIQPLIFGAFANLKNSTACGKII